MQNNLDHYIIDYEYKIYRCIDLTYVPEWPSVMALGLDGTAKEIFRSDILWAGYAAYPKTLQNIINVLKDKNMNTDGVSKQAPRKLFALLKKGWVVELLNIRDFAGGLHEMEVLWRIGPQFKINRSEIETVFEAFTRSEAEEHFKDRAQRYGEAAVRVDEYTYNSTINQFPKTPKPNFQRELESLINKHSMENESNTPDFILAEYMMDCLRAFERVSKKRESWYNTPLSIGTDYFTAEQMYAFAEYRNRPEPEKNISNFKDVWRNRREAIHPQQEKK